MIGAAAATIPTSHEAREVCRGAVLRRGCVRFSPARPGDARAGRLGLRAPGRRRRPARAQGCQARGRRARDADRSDLAGHAGTGRTRSGWPGTGRTGNGRVGAGRPPRLPAQPCPPPMGPPQPGCRDGAAQAADARGFLGALFDFSFTSFVTTKIIKVLYVLIMMLDVAQPRWCYTVIAFRREHAVRLADAGHRGPAVHRHRDGVLAAGPGVVRRQVPDRRGCPGAARARRPLRGRVGPAVSACGTSSRRPGGDHLGSVP